MYSRKNKVYTNQELDQLLLEINLNTPLSELETKLSRTARSIVWKLSMLTQQDPIIWNPAFVSTYEEQYKKQRKPFMQKYYQDNRNTILKRQKDYYNKHREEVRKYQQGYLKKHRQQHAEEIRLYHRQYYKKNKGKWKRFGNYLFELLHVEDKSWTEISDELGVNKNTLSHYLKGDKKPTEKFIMIISRRVNISYKNLQDLLEEIQTSKTILQQSHK